MTDFTHAGGIVTKPADGPDGGGGGGGGGGGRRTLYLLVRSRKAAAAGPEWVFPKGHIEPGETPEQAAVREIREEAGVVGEVVCPVGAIEFSTGRGEVRACYFLVRFVGEAAAAEDRPACWCPFDEALARLSFADARDLLGKARDLAESAAA